MFYSSVTFNSDLFDKKIRSLYFRPEIHHCCQFGENPSNTFQQYHFKIFLAVLKLVESCEF